MKCIVTNCLFVFFAGILDPLPVSANPFPLACHVIPRHVDKICTVITSGTLGPFDDVAIYRHNERGNWTLIETSKDNVSKFDGLGFSKNGKLMWMSWAEEGHPTLSFYRTDDYLKGEAKALSILDDYRFAGLIQLTNHGMVRYTFMPDDETHCPDGRPVHNDVCEKTLKLN